MDRRQRPLPSPVASVREAGGEVLTPTRRAFLTLLSALPVSAQGVSRYARTAESDELDEALKMLAPYTASFGGGLSNHGPMTAALPRRCHETNRELGWLYASASVATW